jgi:hypothetical protein
MRKLSLKDQTQTPSQPRPQPNYPLTPNTAISQKSQNVFQNFKVLKASKGPKGANGTQYYVLDFKYELLTGAGFTVDRKGVASVAQLKNNVLALWTATTAQRYKKLGDDLRTMAESFRVYDGIAQQ